MKRLCALILAAGKGTRMVSDRAKVLHAVCGQPMLRMVYDAAACLRPDEIFVVIGQDADRVRGALGGRAATFIVQEPQLGTGHALICARDELKRRKGDVLVLSGDTPRIKPSTLNRLIERHRSTRAVTTILTTEPPDPFGYGRVVRKSDGSVLAIVEEKDATPEQKKIREINAAMYCFQIPALIDALARLSSDNAQKEYYLTDVIGIHSGDGGRIEAVIHNSYEELQGINNRRELAKLSKDLWHEYAGHLMAGGVTLMDPDQTYIDPQVAIAKDSVIFPHVKLEGATTIGEGCVIRSGVRVTDSEIAARTELLDQCVVTDSIIGEGSVIGPCCHIHSETVIGAGCHIGSLVEVNNSKIGQRTRACHLSYLGNAIIGGDVSIGSGTITCDFDGQRKNVTIVQDGATIGSGCQLIAPVTIGRNASVAAGSRVAEDVRAGDSDIARGREPSRRHRNLRARRK